MENEKQINEQSKNAEKAGVSKSQQKRIDRKQKNEKAKRDEQLGKVISIVAVLLILAGIGYSIASYAIKESNKIEASNDYSAGLTKDGLVEGVNVSSIVTLPTDYASISVPASEVEYTDEMWNEEIDTQLENHKVLNSESEAEIKDGDKVNIDYVGSIDGVEFEGGNSQGAGADLTIGSGQFIPGFEDQLIGHKNGEVFDIDVTFPEEYGSADLAGKDAVFNVTVNGIYEKGVFDDDFVAENLKAYADTVDGYREYLAKKEYDNKLQTYVKDYLSENTTISSYPKKYLKNLKSVQKYSDQQSYEYMNQMYMSYYGQGYSSFEEYTGQTEEEYDESLDEKCKDTEKTVLLYQAIAEKEGMTISDDDVKAYVKDLTGSEDSYDSQVESYGEAYLKQMAREKKVIDFCVNNAVVQ